MKKLKAWAKSKSVELSFPSAALLLLLSTVCIAFICFWLAPQSLRVFLDALKANPSLFILNYIPILLLALLLYFLSQNPALSSSITATFFVALSIANRVKVSMRQDPLVPADLTLITEVSAILKTFNYAMLLQYLLVAFFFYMLIRASLWFFRPKHMDKRIRIGGGIVCIAVGILCNMTVYNSETLYDSYPVSGNIYFKVNQYVSKGFLYSFIHDFHTLKVEAPQGYNAQTYKTAEESFTVPSYEDTVKPHIVMIMGEAYSDLSENEHLDFSNYQDPMANFKSLCQEEGSISGHIIVPHFGGGTSDTEYDVLTACPTRYIGNTLASYSFIRKNFDALPRRLMAQGYNTMAIHPGYGWFYNRQNVYPYLGFEEFYYLENNFDEKTQNKGGYISEEATFDAVIAQLDNHFQTSDNPLFQFTVTIQNHGPYEDKYPDTVMNFDTDVPLTSHQINLLSNYFVGILDADVQLKRLTDYLNTVEEPVILVYFGDHLPGFSNGMEFFDLLDYDIDMNGTVEERLNVYRTPFLIWQNETARIMGLLEEGLEKANLPETLTISANYLGALTMELLGMGDISPLFSYSNALRKELPVIANSSFMTADSQFTEEITANQQEELAYLQGWGYYKLFDDELTSNTP